MRVLILGADGYLGWPTAMFFSKEHEVLGIDNYMRRNLCNELDTTPLFQVPSLNERAKLWKTVSDKHISVKIGDLKDWDFVSGVLKEFQPEAIIHYAEQPSAPYSMLNRKAAMITITNNLVVTANIIHGVREFAPNAHIIKLGTMGEYGTPNIDIEEGWLEINHKGRCDTFLYPRQASSLYHTTKIMDTDLLWFYVRMWDLRVTDLMQGPVYGLHTPETTENDLLFPFFNYDEIFGTVINRFIVQAVVGYPLTVYGKGGQTRGYINIIDTLNCIKLTMENPPPKGELKIFNQITETFTVKELAEKIKLVGDKIGLNVSIMQLKNPRKEAEEHYYNPTHTGLSELGLIPHYLTEEVIHEMLKTVKKYDRNIKSECIFKNIKWA